MMVDPPSPSAGKAFRMTALVPGLACEKIKESALTLPPKWMLVSETLVKKAADCLLVKVLVAPEAGVVTPSRLKVVSSDGVGREVVIPSVTVGEGGAAGVAAEAGTVADLDKFIAEIRNFLSSYVLGAPAPPGSGFSIESCREPVQNLLMVLLGLKPSIHRERKFQPGCDVQGSSELALNKAIPLDFQVRNLGGIDRFKGVATVTVGNGEGLDRIIHTRVEQGEAFHEGQTLVRFSMAHARTVSPDLPRLSLVDRSNEGKVKIIQFRGKAIAREIPFTEQRFLVEQKK
jgi:hypothetical protein